MEQKIAQQSAQIVSTATLLLPRLSRRVQTMNSIAKDLVERALLRQELTLYED